MTVGDQDHGGIAVAVTVVLGGLPKALHLGFRQVLARSEVRIGKPSRCNCSVFGGRRDQLEVSPNLWAGVGLVRGDAGTALVGNPEEVAARIKEYAALGIETFIFSGYPHLEEAYRVAELLFPLLPLEKTRPSGQINLTGTFGEVIANDIVPPQHDVEHEKAKA